MGFPASSLGMSIGSHECILAYVHDWFHDLTVDFLRKYAYWKPLYLNFFRGSDSRVARSMYDFSVVDVVVSIGRMDRRRGV
jgi:hypothetical protein